MSDTTHASILDKCSPTDLRRYALCYIYSDHTSTVDWDAAAAAYGSEVKPASFKTMTSKALKKLLHGDDGPASPKKKAGPSPSKKAKLEDADDNAESPEPKAKGKGKGKKAAVKEEVHEDDAADSVMAGEDDGN